MAKPNDHHSDPAREAVVREDIDNVVSWLRSGGSNAVVRAMNNTAASIIERLSASPAPTVEIFNVGDRTLAQVFRPAGLTDVSDLQAVLDAVEAALAPAAEGLEAVRKIAPSEVVAWAVEQWNAQVKNRPLVNVHRRSLDDAWRRVMREFGGDPDGLVGPSHDELHAACVPSPKGDEHIDDALASPAATSAETQGGDGVAVNKAEAILRQVRKFIAAENKHARLCEQGKNSTRDDVDFEHAQLVGDFSERDCDEALRIVKRRAAALAPSTSAATRGIRCTYCGDTGTITDRVDGEITCPECGYAPAPVESAQVKKLKAGVARVKSDREYVIGFNDGWDEAIKQNLRFPTMLRKMWAGQEVQKWIDDEMARIRASLATDAEG